MLIMDFAMHMLPCSRLNRIQQRSSYRSCGSGNNHLEVRQVWHHDFRQFLLVQHVAAYMWISQHLQCVCSWDLK